MSAAFASGVPVPKRRARGQGPMLASHERLRDLAAANTFVQELRNKNDLLERLILDENGTDLRGVVDKIGTLVNNTVRQHGMYHERMRLAMEKRGEGTLSSFVHQTLSVPDKNSVTHMFSSAIEDNRNDDKARTSQLAILFAALTIEVDVRTQLTAKAQAVSRFADTLSAVASSSPADAEREARQRANEIQREPLLLFLTTTARELLTKYTENVIDTRTYVDACVDAYLSFKPAMNRHVLTRYYEGRPGAIADEAPAKL